MSFGLCLGTESSPSLHILRDPHNVESELHDLAKAYLKKHVVVDKLVLSLCSSMFYMRI